jgi:methylenetetrahydrofolate reductase (NADPH)
MNAVAATTVPDPAAPDLRPMQLDAGRDEPRRSRLESLLRNGQFAVTAEMSPPDSADAADVYDRVQALDGCVDAINATDASGANVHMSSLAVSVLLHRAGYCPVMQVSCRDRNRIAIQGDILGAAALGITNILCLTGDGVQTGDHPEAKPVFDFDSISLLRTLRSLRDDRQFISGRPLTSPPRLFLGAAENPSSGPIEMRAMRLRTKLDAGAQFIQTQFCFDIVQLTEFMKRVRDMGVDRKIFILAGVGPLASARAARWIQAHVPGVHIPEDIVQRLERAANPKDEGRRICVELMQQMRDIPGIAGLHVMAFRQEAFVGEMIDAAGILGDRKPLSVRTSST